MKTFLKVLKGVPEPFPDIFLGLSMEYSSKPSKFDVQNKLKIDILNVRLTLTATKSTHFLNKSSICTIILPQILPNFYKLLRIGEVHNLYKYCSSPSNW